MLDWYVFDVYIFFRIYGWMFVMKKLMFLFSDLFMIVFVLEVLMGSCLFNFKVWIVLLILVILLVIVVRVDLYVEEVVELLLVVLRIYLLLMVILFGVSDCDRYLL